MNITLFLLSKDTAHECLIIMRNILDHLENEKSPTRRITIKRGEKKTFLVNARRSLICRIVAHMCQSRCHKYRSHNYKIPTAFRLFSSVPRTYFTHYILCIGLRRNDDNRVRYASRRRSCVSQVEHIQGESRHCRSG